MSKLKKEVAFTLAEVLITLGIIGVVAALTVPSLINSTNDAEFYTAVRKFYSVLSQATLQMVNENQSLWDNSSANATTLSQNMADAYAKYFSYIKEDTSDKIQTQNIKCYKSSTNCASPTSGRYGLLLKDGMTLRFLGTQNCSGGLSPASNGNRCGDIIIDINGDKGPNMFGRDAYDFFIIQDTYGNYKAVPSGVGIDTNYTCVANTTDAKESYGCTELVLKGQTLPQ